MKTSPGTPRPWQALSALALGLALIAAAMVSAVAHASPDEARGGSARSSALAPDDVNFLSAASQSGILQVRAGEAAIAKSSKSDVRALAELSILDHGAANERLRALAVAKGLPLPEELDGPHEAKLSQLERLTGTSFDTQYVRNAGIVDHEQAVKLYEKGAISSDADIRRFAEAVLPRLRIQLKQARRIEDDSMARQVTAR
jgi:putative membrane protein